MRSGNGWFNFQGGSYTKSMAQCLVDGGYSGGLIIDPTGDVSGSSQTNNRYTYMKYSCTLNGRSATYVYAKLAGLPQSSTATNGTYCASCDSNYGMNYYKATN
ncbi:MAG: hypothetical protein ACI9GH_000544 [Candidatus Paceibacteria bacterium]|jgi:hypothetical protein